MEKLITEYVRVMAEDCKQFNVSTLNELIDGIGSRIRSRRGYRHFMSNMKWCVKEPFAYFYGRYGATDKFFIVWKDGSTSLLFIGPKGGGVNDRQFLYSI